MNQPSHIELRGFFKLTAVNADTGEERFLGEFENLLLDGGLNGCGTAQMMAACAVGSGSTAPIVTNTQLENLINSTTNRIAQTIGGDASGYGWIRTTYQFAAGSAAGNISEIGIGNTATNLLSRTLIKDGSGNPTSITVLSNEYFNVQYEVRGYPPAADVTFNATIQGVIYACVIRPCLIGTSAWAPWFMFNVATTHSGDHADGDDVELYDGDIGPMTGRPSGSSYGVGQIVYSGYVNNSLSVSAITPPIGLDAANFSTGIKSIEFGTSCGRWQCSFTPPIPKDNTKTLALNLSASWSRKS